MLMIGTTRRRATTIVEGAFIWMAFILGADLPAVALAQSSDWKQIPKTIDFAYLPLGIKRKSFELNWRPKMGDWPVILLRDFSDPDDHHRLTLLRFSFHEEARSQQPAGAYQSGWNFQTVFARQTRIVSWCGYPYELTRRQRGYWFERVQLDPSIMLPERQENYFSVAPETTFQCYYRSWEPPRPPERPKEQTSSFGYSLAGFERVAEQSYAVLQIDHGTEVEWIRDDLVSCTESLDDPLLESPEQLVVWKNRYRARVGDVVRTKQFKFIVRRIVPPDAQGRHQGWVDLELIHGLDPLPAAPR